MLLPSSLFVKRKRISEMMLENVTTRRLGAVRHLDKSWKVIFVMYISCEQWCSLLSYFSFDYNLHCICQGSQWVWDFTFINPGVIFTCILDNQFCFADAALKHPTTFHLDNKWFRIALSFTEQVQYVSLKNSNFTFAFRGNCGWFYREERNIKTTLFFGQ